MKKTNKSSQAQDSSPKDQSPKSAQQIVELTEALQRAQADLVNYRNRAEKEKADLAVYVKAEVVTDLLPIIDNLERALSYTPKELAKNEWAQGVIAVGSQMQEMLAALGVEKIKTVGKPFDPNLHEAVSVDGDKGDEVISEELQSGWRLGDTILRHAMVRVVRKGK